MAQEVQIKEFGVEDTPKPFKVHGELFYIVGDLPLTLVDNVARWQQKGVQQSLMEDGINMLFSLLEEFLLPESYARFKRQVDEKKIGLRTVVELLPWVLEQYGLRPTQPSSPSSDGSDDGETGTSSTDGVQPEELTLFNFAPTGS